MTLDRFVQLDTLDKWGKWIVVAITILVYLNIFPNQFVIDDTVFIKNWQDIRTFSSFPKLLIGSAPFDHQGVYRPIRSILYLVYYHLFGTNPIGYHIHSLLVHVASILLIYLIVEQLPVFKKKASQQTLAFITSLLFGLHPIHTEAITYIAASMDTTGIVLFLASFYLYIIKKYRSSVCVAFFAFFTYEMTLTLPLVILLYSMLFKKTRRISHVLLYVLGIVIYLGIRFGVLGITTRGPYLADSIYLTFLTMTRVLVTYILLLVAPIKLANNHMIAPGIEAFVYRNYATAAIKLQSLSDPAIFLSLVILLGLVAGAMVLRKKQPIISFCIFWFFITLLPVSEIVPQGAILNERSLYLPSFGFLLLLAWVFTRVLSSTWRWIGALVLVFFVFVYGARTVLRNLDWHDDVTFWKKDVAVYPTGAYNWFALGNAYNEKRDYTQALDAYQQSITYNPGFAVGWASLGRTSASLGKGEDAKRYYQKALEIDPNFMEVKKLLYDQQ